MTHLPFRSRCRHCVRGRGKEEDCRRTVTEERYVPGALVDNMFMGGEKGSALALMVVRERTKKLSSARWCQGRRQVRGYVENSRRGIRRIELEFGGVVVKSDNECALTSQTKNGEVGAQYGGSEEVDGRMDMSKRFMARHREIGLEFVDIIVKADNEPALTSLVESWSTLRAMMSGSRMIVWNSPVASSKSNGIEEGAIRQVDSLIGTIQSSLEGRWLGRRGKRDGNNGIVYVSWPWMRTTAY